MSDSDPSKSPNLIVARNILISAAIEDSERTKIASDDIVPFYQGLLVESERSVGILAFTFIESQIYDLFSQQLDPNVQGGVESIIGPQGILDTVGAQIKMLHSLRWLRSETQQDLRILARIRNRFAHAHSALTFEDGKIRGYLSSLTKHEEKFSAKHPGAVLLARHTYLVRALVTLFMLYGDVTLMPCSLRAGLGPTGAFAAGFDRYPPQLQQALGWCMEAVSIVYKDATSPS